MTDTVKEHIQESCPTPGYCDLTIPSQDKYTIIKQYIIVLSINVRTRMSL